ncbi:MAG: hypothetical protein L3K09_00720 [Thermoplasmata archaeon]|nr:hypothetical protein [Thermoplasmata archaeon]
MASTPTATARPALADRQGIPRRQKMVGGGLALTFLGLFLVVLLFPVAPDVLLRTIPAVGAGLLCLWVGGILMGRAMGSKARPQP